MGRPTSLGFSAILLETEKNNSSVEWTLLSVSTMVMIHDGSIIDHLAFGHRRFPIQKGRVFVLIWGDRE